MARRFLPVFLVLVLLSGWVRGEDDTRKAAKAHLNAARKGMETELRVFRVPQLFIWSRRVLFAELDVYEKVEDRIAAFESHLKRAREFEMKISALHKDGSVAIQDVVEARFQTARAESWLAEAKATKAKGPARRRDADTPTSAPPVVPKDR